MKDIWLDEGNDLIRSCGALSKVLGLQRSFSCGDILTISDSLPIRQTRSDTFLMACEDYTWGRLDANSRSLSTWVAVGDVEESTSQLPSPHVELNKVRKRPTTFFPNIIFNKILLGLPMWRPLYPFHTSRFDTLR